MDRVAAEDMTWKTVDKDAEMDAVFTPLGVFVPTDSGGWHRVRGGWQGNDKESDPDR